MHGSEEERQPHQQHRADQDRPDKQPGLRVPLSLLRTVLVTLTLANQPVVSCSFGNCADARQLASYNSVTCNSSKTERFDPNRFISMRLRPKYPQLANVVFLDKVGETLRQATSDIVQEELPEEILLLLRRLERLEQQKAPKDSDDKS